MFVVDRDGSHDGADLSELSGLNNLRGQLRIKNLRFVKNAKEKFKTPILKGKQHLRSLTLEWNGDNDDDDNKLLEDLQPHPNLKELCIDGWGGDAKFPSWLSLLTNLVHIYIWGPNKFKYLPSVAQLPCLQDLTIRDCYELEYMDDNSPKGSQGEPESFFPSLKCLDLENCQNMKSWWRTTKPIDDDSNEDDTTVMGTSTMAFPCLCTLSIQNCPLTSMPLYPSVDDNLRLENTSSRPFKQTIKMKMNAKTPSSSTSSLPLSKLKSFHVKNMEDMDTPMLDEYMQHLTSLETLTIDGDCKEMELSAPKFQIFQDHTSLRSLSLENIPKCWQLPEWIQHLTNLQELRLLHLPNLTSLPDEMRCLTNLQCILHQLICLWHSTPPP
ncbi:Putative disease resistance RGA4 [Gossypium arboreum]|uniref:Putative disease resistance RGA4 n=1 Tax=Gossypium arboreum TaxID=29729 RepID=A0A0B0MHA4_GOSAR|nr:Putative disease resistance RGA4 [Gossypium arboreum]